MVSFGKVQVFELNNCVINGIIQEISRQGQLIVKLDNEEVRVFNIKEIKLLY